MNDDTDKMLAEAKARLGLHRLEEMPTSSGETYRWVEGVVGGHKFLAFGKTMQEALRGLEAMLSEGRSCEVSTLRSKAGKIREEAERRAAAFDADAVFLSAKVRAGIAAAKASRGVVS